MADGIKFSKGELFAWGSALYRADTPCEVWPHVIVGDVEVLAQFEIECEPETAKAMIEAAGGDTQFLMIGSDCGADEGLPEDDDDDV
jgi:hypothetical protein